MYPKWHLAGSDISWFVQEGTLYDFLGLSIEKTLIFRIIFTSLCVSPFFVRRHLYSLYQYTSLEYYENFFIVQKVQGVYLKMIRGRNLNILNYLKKGNVARLILCDIFT